MLKSINLGGDVINIIDERVGIPESYGNLSVTFNTDNGMRSFPNNKDFDMEDIIIWLENHPEDMERIKDKMRRN